MTVLLKKPLKFLVVDDSRAIQAIVRRAIQHCGFEPLEIRTALDGEQALDIMESFVPDLIITDWHMPKVSGLEMLQALRQMGHKSVRVGFVTTERTPALLDQAISNGAMFIIHKPFNDAELAEVVMASVQDLAQPVDGVALTPPPEPAPAPAPPTEVPAAIAEPAEPISEAVMQQQLQTYLGKIPFRLIAHDAMTSAKLTPTNLLGLFTAPGHKGVYAIGVLDTNAVCMIGGGAARKGPPEVRAAMETGQPDDTMLAKANEFFRLLAPALGESASPQALEVSLAKASIVKNSFAKLAEVLLQTEQRSDFRLSIPGYGEGRMAFFVMSAPL
jgi:CheY-like chemotaxis protein